METAINKFDELYAAFGNLDLDLASLLQLRNLSGFVGALYAQCICMCARRTYRANPHQDGYPDLLFMDKAGRRAWNTFRSQRGEKKPFSPFKTGGLEVKCTCGDVPSPKECKKRRRRRPGLGDPRIEFLRSYTWKAHHRNTNYLLGVVWDFIDHVPTIVAIFYAPNLTRNDWGKLQKPKTGGGNTTSVTQMKRAGVVKMSRNWLAMIADERYHRFFARVTSLPVGDFSEP